MLALVVAGPVLGRPDLVRAAIEPRSTESPRSTEQTRPLAAGGASGPRLRVLLDEDPPFVVREGDRWTGWSLDLWTEAARQAGFEWTIVGEGSPDKIVEALAAGHADVGLGDISVTQERASRIDFSHPFFHAGARILVPIEHPNPFLAAIGSLGTRTHLLMFAGVVALLVGMSALVYLLGRRHDPDNFPAGRGEGAAEALYVAINALLNGKLERRLLPGAPGRVLAIAWMVLGTGLVSYLTAAVAAALAVQHLRTGIQDLDDLSHRTVSAVAGHQTVKWLAHHGVRVLPRPDLDAAVASLLDRQVDAVVHDEPSLGWWISRNPSAGLTLTGRTFDTRDYAIALRHESPLRIRLNVALLTLQDNGFFAELDRRWIGGSER